jgi:hypothetical protein
MESEGSLPHSQEPATPWSRVLLEKLVKKFPAFYGIRRFITALTRACHQSLSLWEHMMVENIGQQQVTKLYILILAKADHIYRCILKANSRC